MGEIIKQKRTDIQALRAIAVIAVVVYHLWPNLLTGGFMGVDIFFVISGYLMTVTLIKHASPVITSERKTRSTLSYLSEFYTRRIKRLIPAASVTLLATLGLVAATGNFSMIENTAKQVAGSALFVQNWLLNSESVDYLANAEPPTAVQHFWSLSLEEQFYLVWPLLLLAILFLTFHLTILYKSTKIPGAVIPVGILIILFFLYGYFLTKTNPSAAYFVTPARVWELLFGALIALLPVLKHRDLKLLLPWLGTIMIIYPLFKWDGAGFPGWHALIPVIGTALILYGGTSTSDSKLSFSSLLKYRPIQWVGDISYSLYLWHWPFIVLLPVLFTVNIEGEGSLFIKFGILVLSVIVAWLCYRFVEIPPQKLVLKKRWVYLSFVVTVGSISGLGLYMSHASRSQAEQKLHQLHSLALNKESCLGAESLRNKKECGNGYGIRDEQFAQLGPNDDFTKVIRTGQVCEVYHPTPGIEPNPTQYCTVGNTDAKKQIAIWGDSHASQWINTFDEIGQRNNIKFIMLSSGQCGGMQIKAPECEDRLNFIKNSDLLKNSDAIIVALWFRYPSDFRIQPTNTAISTLKSLTDSPIYLLEDVPVPGDEGGPLCLTQGTPCKNTFESSTWAIRGISERLVSEMLLPKKNIIKTSDFFCDTDYCYSHIGGVPVYNSYATKDDLQAAGGNAHLTGTYSLTLAPVLESRLKEAGAIK